MKFYRGSLLPVFLVNLGVAIFLSLNLQLINAGSLLNETDKLALLKFKAGIASDPHEVSNSWNDSLPFCRWDGITCSRRHQRVTSLVLEGQNLVGSISPFIGNLSFLRILNLQNNSFNGPIPQEVGNLFRLQEFFLNNNTIDGEIPIDLSRCSELRIINLMWNNLAGKIPAELGSLQKLDTLRLSVNNLKGEIPPSLGNLSSLTLFYVADNMLEGNIPSELRGMTCLKVFAVGMNRLSGIIPQFLFNISSIVAISTTSNQLSGSLPKTIGLHLQNLQHFGIANNRFSESIPNSFCNVSQLQILDASSNNFVGQVPNCLGNFPSLSWLAIEDNILENDSKTFLESLKNCSNLNLLTFRDNYFGGILPDSIGNLSVQLNYLYFGGNQIEGIIPDSLQNLINLIGLRMENNLLTGIIPSSLGKLEKLQVWLLYGNRFYGQIPSSIGNLTQLFTLTLAENRFEGTIPASITNCRNLQLLDWAENNLSGSIPKEVLRLSSLSILLNLSHNLLTGELQADVGKLININELDVSGNNLSGEIPGNIGDCSSLEYLHMQGNSFQGAIPSSLGSLKGLKHLDLSLNDLTEEIPNNLERLQFLSYLNLSFNNLVGEVPTRGVFRNASALSLMGNDKLCGGAPKLDLPKCPTKAIKKGKSIAFKLAITVPCAILCVLFMSAAFLAHQRRSKKRLAAVSEEMGRLIQVSYGSLYHATSEFSADNLIGSGSFGSVYKGFLDQLPGYVAIKVLKLETYGASKSFMAECKVLRTVRHRNLVKLLTYCSSIDYKQNEFKALVFEFMGNGSLETWLHDRNNNQSRKLNILQRLNIAIDVASALHYLQDLCESPVIHCDLKPSNVLLDDELVAHVSDFGLAKLFLTDNDQSQSHTSSIGVKGTFGYAPPEYGMGSEASKEGDVYSYGILVLEMFTGKRPTDQIFQDHLNLYNFVMNALPSRLVDIMDPTLLPLQMEETPVTISEGDEEMEIHEEGEVTNRSILSRMSAKEIDGLLSVFKVGVACSAQSPNDRMKMGDVVKELHLIKSTFLGVRIYG